MKTLLLIVALCSPMAAQYSSYAGAKNASTVLGQSDNGQISLGFWGSCGDTPCAGGAGNTTSITLTTGIASPSVSGASLALAATFPASGNNVLFDWKPGAGTDCPTCTWIRFDFWAYLPTGVANYEFDSFIFCKTCTANPALTTGMDAMFGKQCNTTIGKWQYANQSSAWQTSGVSCSLSTGVWHHFIFSDSYDKADTSCTGSVPCLHFNSITVDGVTTSWGGATIAITALNAGWAAVANGCQMQMDSSAASTATEYVDFVSCWVGK